MVLRMYTIIRKSPHGKSVDFYKATNSLPNNRLPEMDYLSSFSCFQRTILHTKRPLSRLSSPLPEIDTNVKVALLLYMALKQMLPGHGLPTNGMKTPEDVQ